MTKLKAIYLSYNQLTSIDPQTFMGLINLVYIGLDNNQISSLDSKTFNGLKNSNI